jgi:hypothetical protein
MKVIFLFLAVIAVSLGCNNQKETPPAKKETTVSEKTTTSSKKDLLPADIQIKLAVLAAPPEKRDSCTVYGYDADKQLTVLKKGTNELICLADNPDEPDFSVACYCKELEPFMQRGRDLRKQGISGQQLFDERGKEVAAGTLKMPKGPAALYVYSAKDKDVNTATGEVKNGYLRYVIYIPFATAASTGLPEKPSADGMPWIMNPGTYRAHIMINP